MSTNDAETPIILLKIAAKVLPEVIVQPRVGHFGEVAKDHAKDLELTRGRPGVAGTVVLGMDRSCSWG